MRRLKNKMPGNQSRWTLQSNKQARAERAIRGWPRHSSFPSLVASGHTLRQRVFHAYFAALIQLWKRKLTSHPPNKTQVVTSNNEVLQSLWSQVGQGNIYSKNKEMRAQQN
ncbi:uncharacterized protein LOC144010435 isoform X2 [Festucalex cinctus]